MSEIDELLDSIGFKDGDTYAVTDFKFYTALCNLNLSERDTDDTFAAYLKVADHEGPKPLTRRERWLMRVAITRIVKERKA